jgi:hypothetical protein
MILIDSQDQRINDKDHQITHETPICLIFASGEFQKVRANEMMLRWDEIARSSTHAQKMKINTGRLTGSLPLRFLRK